MVSGKNRIVAIFCGTPHYRKICDEEDKAAEVVQRRELTGQW